MKNLLRILLLFLMSSFGFGQAANQLMTISSNGHYLVNSAAGNSPVYIVGDDAFLLMTELCAADVTTYLDDRHTKGYNLIWAEAADGTYTDHTPPHNCNGDLPFTGTDFGTLNSAYWTFIDSVVTAASTRGMTILFNPAFVGTGPTQGWFNDFTGAGTSGCCSSAVWTGYCTALANRYKTANNIIWLLGGDFDPSNATAKTNVNACGTALAANDPNHLITVEMCRSCNSGSQSTVTGYGGSTPAFVGLNASYDQQANITASNGCPVSYTQSSLPVLEVEAWYEASGGHGLTGLQLRQEGYSSTFAGCPLGFIYGHGQIWTFSSTNTNTAEGSTPNWKTILSSVGAVGEQYLGQLMRTREHWLMVPDASNTYLTAGFNSGTTLSVAARSSDGQTIMVYMPDGNATAKTLNMAGITSGSSTVKAWWFNPQTAVATLIGTFANSGTHNFTAPDANDWVLVLDNASANLPAPGQPFTGVTVTNGVTVSNGAKAQ